MPKLSGINHLQAVKTLEKAGFYVARQGKHIVMSNDVRIVTIPRHNPVNAFTIGGIVRDAGLTMKNLRSCFNCMRAFIVSTILVFCCLAIGCGLGGHYIQSTNSMSPAIGIGDHFTTIEIESKTLNPIERFDIVIYKPQPNKTKLETEENTKFAHRVIGMPNEKIEIKKGAIYINDKLLDEPFEKNVGGRDYPATVIPENEFFLLGDNRPNSLDSRYREKPTVKREDIYGKVTTIINKEDYENGKRW